MTNQQNRTRNTIHELQDLGWTLAAIAGALQININTIYRWRDNGANDQNQGRIEALKSIEEQRRWGFVRGVYYIQMKGTPWVKIGSAQNLAKRMGTLQTSSPYVLRLVAWHPHQKESGHHKRWEASRGIGEWFEYHPNMEQEASEKVVEAEEIQVVRDAAHEEALMEDWRYHYPEFNNKWGSVRSVEEFNRYGHLSNNEMTEEFGL